MKFIVSVFLIALLSVASCLYLPWWSVAVVAFIVAALIPQKPFLSFISGFAALFLLWGGLAWYLSNNNNDLLAHKVSLIILKMDSPIALIIVTALIGSLVAGFAALSGSFVHKKSIKQG